MKSALFRVDGSHHLGMGHMMRCLAFAQGLDRVGAKSIFVIRDYEPKMTELIQHYGYTVETIPADSSFGEDASLTSEFASGYGADLLITDLSNPDNLANLDEYSRYFPVLGVSDTFTISLDDLIRIDFPYDVQVIPYYGAENINYKSQGGTKLLLGPAYFIFRKEFIEAAGASRVIREDAQNILVTIGGSDPLNLTIIAARALNRLKVTSLKVRFVIGPGFGPLVRQELERILENFQGNYEVLVGNNNIADLMLWSDLAITGGGLTKYEMAVTGTPGIIISHNQREAKIAEEFARGGSTLHLGLFSQIGERDIAEAIEKLLDDDALRAEMADRGRKMVDGKGVARIISEIPRSVLS